MAKEIDYSEVLITPLSDIIREIAVSIGQSQKELDLQSINTQKLILTDSDLKDLKDIGYQTTWYYMPEINIELKTSVYYEESESSETKKRRLFFAPFNAKYQNNFSYKSEGSSIIKIKIVPVPHPTENPITK